jgi:hypothetical protein
MERMEWTIRGIKEVEMKRFVLITLVALAAMAAVGVQEDLPVQVPGVDAVQAGGCGCPKTAPVCCINCDGSFAYCARSHAFCPECAAP